MWQVALPDHGEDPKIYTRAASFGNQKHVFLMDNKHNQFNINFPPEITCASKAYF